MPSDSFVQLHLPRRPFLPEEKVRDAFHRLAAEHHPDKSGGESSRFAELTTAFETLRNPVTLLKHLIDLENLAAGGDKPGIPPDLAEVFPVVAKIRQQIGAAIEKRRAASNALARSLTAGESADARRSAEELSQRLDAIYDTALAELRQIDLAWPAPEARAALPALHARFAFLTKWRDQLRESLLQLQLS
jgi:curved DNA-binding protein CbpA